MIHSTVHVQASRDAIRAAIAQAPSAARAGGAIANAMMTRCGLAILGRIKQAFVIKSHGGTDEAGDSWKSLSPKTIAYSNTRQRGRGGRTRTEKKRDTHPSQALNARQKARWWEVYRRQMAIYKGDKSKRGHAAAVAWLVLKGEGATTLVQKYGGRQVDILRDTGLLLNSLSPGHSGGEQIFRVQPGAVIVGTNRKGAAAHHHGIPGRLPQRRLWPPPSAWPQSWWSDVLDQAKQGILDIAAQLVKEVTGK